MIHNSQQDLLDENMDKKIKACFINSERPSKSRVFVIYEDNSRENIWTFNPQKNNLDRGIFIGMTKLKAVYYCDRECWSQNNSRWV